jgi:hypothetical protein
MVGAAGERERVRRAGTAVVGVRLLPVLPSAWFDLSFALLGTLVAHCTWP